MTFLSQQATASGASTTPVQAGGTTTVSSAQPVVQTTQPIQVTQNQIAAIFPI